MGRPHGPPRGGFPADLASLPALAPCVLDPFRASQGASLLSSQPLLETKQTEDVTGDAKSLVIVCTTVWPCLPQQAHTL